jgi:hypothetical protein
LSSIQETRNGPLERKIEVLDQVDYRLAETEEDKDEIYRLRYRAYLNEGTIESNRDRKVTDRFDDLPNTWIFGVYLDGMLASSLRISIASPEWPDTPSVSVFPEILRPELASGKVMVDPTRFCRRSLACQADSGIALCDVAAGLCRLRIFPRRSWPRFGAGGTSGVLQAGFSPHHFAAAGLPDPDQADLPDGDRFSEHARKGLYPISLPAFELFRAAHAV